MWKALCETRWTGRCGEARRGPVAGLSDTARNDLFAPPPVRAGMALH